LGQFKQVALQWACAEGGSGYAGVDSLRTRVNLRMYFVIWLEHGCKNRKRGLIKQKLVEKNSTFLPNLDEHELDMLQGMNLQVQAPLWRTLLQHAA